MKVLERLANIDRRYIFLLIALAVIVPLLLRISMSVAVTGEVQSVYDYIEKLESGSTIILALDYDPAALVELSPMAQALLRHAFSRDIKVIGLTLWPTGAALGSQVMRETAEGVAQEWEDYIYLGYITGATSVIMRMGEDISSVYPRDYGGKDLSEIPMMEGVKNYKDIALIIDLGAGDSPVWWINYAGTTYKQTIAIGCTGVIAKDLYRYLDSGQIIGLIGGMKGAAEYEKLVESHGMATVGMASQSMAHVVIILLIVIANIQYFVMRRRRE